ncbi:hypothetical protein H0H87_005399, partial [Tephrocybe sp. NHM501043]
KHPRPAHKTAVASQLPELAMDEAGPYAETWIPQLALPRLHYQRDHLAKNLHLVS